MLGILYALVPMFAWGSIGFASNKIGGRPNQQTLGMTLGALIFAFIIWLVVKPEMTPTLWGIGILGGILWAVGQNGQFNAMKHMGVSVANPLSSGAQLVIGGLIGALIFKEWFKPVHFLLGIPAMMSLLVGFYFLSKQDNSESTTVARDFKKGFFSLTYSTLGYVSYVVLFNNIMKFDALAVIFPMSIGMVLGAAAFMKFQIKLEPVVLKNSLVGGMWAVGNVFMFLAAAEAGLAIAFSFSQLGAVISVIGGILFLGETKTKKEQRWVTIGILAFVVGAILLGIVKAN